MTTEAQAAKPDDMYESTYWEIQKVLDKFIGGNEEDGEGAGIVADVYLLGDERDKAREQRNAALARIKALDGLLACYRAGIPPTERLHRELAKTTADMAWLTGEPVPEPAPIEYEYGTSYPEGGVDWRTSESSARTRAKELSDIGAKLVRRVVGAPEEVSA